MELQGAQGADSLTGGADSDTIYGYGGNDTLKGGAGDDVLAGNDGNDILQGGDGDDYILGGAGNDTIDGGAGNDWAAYEDAAAGVKIDLTLTATQNTVGAGTDKLTSIENVYGSAFNDTLTGNAEANMLVGGAGNDTVSGGKGDDTLWGSAGNDTLDGGDGDDYMVGGAGDDIIKGGAGWDWSSYEDATAGVTVDLNKTTAQNTGGGGTDTIAGVEHLYGSAFNDVLTGDAKDNYLWGDAGDDKLVGGAGDDHLSGGAGVNIIDGGDGFDTVDYAFSDKGVSINLSGAPAPQVSIPDSVDTIISVEAAMGSAYNDYIVGNDAENYLFGDAGADVLYGIGGHDTLDGGDGNDILRGSFHKPGDLLLGGAGDDQIIVWTGAGSEGDATTVDGGSGVDDLIFSTYDSITLDLKNTGDQVVTLGVHMVVSNIENVMGSYGDDHLTGDAGNNEIIGGAGDDILDGGAGFDIASYEGDQSVRVDLSKTGPQNTGGAGIDALSNFEGLTGSLRSDILIGDAKDNSFEGGLGDDIIDGGAGADTAIFWGQAKDYTWTLNADGTWTVKGLEGTDTLLNIETLKFNDKSVTLTPSTTTVTVDDLVTSGPTVLFSSRGASSDAILSADGRTTYVATFEGHVKAIDTVTAEVRADISVGIRLGGMDVSADGRYLVVTEGQIVDRHSPGGSPAPMAAVHVVDLQTGTVKDYMTFVNGQDGAFVDAAFTSDGKILLTQGNANGVTPITVLDPATMGFTRSAETYWNSGALSVTDDHSKVLLAPTGISPGSLYILDSGAVQTAGANPAGTSNTGIQAMTGNGSMVAQWSFPGSINIYDGALKFKIDLAAASPYAMNVHGMDFSADGKHLYVVDAVTDQIFDFSTKTWTLNEIYAIGADVGVAYAYAGAGGAYGDRVTLSIGGQRMIIMDDQKVISVNMATLKVAGGTEAADILQGTGSSELLRGFGGDDTINAGNGGDTIIGGLGADKLTGGQGDDIFVFAKGDTTWSLTSDAGVDTILDWEAGDRLSFGPHDEVIHYAEQTATSWTAAATAAPQIMASQHLSYLATQVGADVYVFAAPNGAANGAIESVVKLANTTLDKISADNFLPVGDDRDNVLTGGALDERLFGGGGDDTINGGKGWDLLYGGGGVDTFVFAPGDSTFSTVSNGRIDVITDWEAGDKLSFAPLGSSFQLAKRTATTWDEVMTDAVKPVGVGMQFFKAYQVYNDVYVFYVPDGSTGVVENGVRLMGATLDKIDLTTFIPNAGLPLYGDDAANLLIGGKLDDAIYGKGGADTIVGGRGADFLTGGDGNDRFLFGAGDTTWSANSDAGVDVITDWQSEDSLSFGPSGPYSEATAGNWSEALTKATTTMAAYHSMQLAIQVGNDVYLFAGSSDRVQNVVKLLNTDLDKISIDNFSWQTGMALNGDEAANTLYGGLANDVINGFGGDDIIIGGYGKDTMTGGAGADIFKFQWSDSTRVLSGADVITDFGQGDKLAFAGGPAVIKESDILRFTAVLNPDGAVSAASQLTIDAYSNQIATGALNQKYMIVSAGADTYVLADTDVTPSGLDLAVKLLGVTGSTMTADMFMAA